MTKFLIHRFVRNYNDTENTDVRQSYGRLSGIVGIATNTLLFFIKVTAGTVFHSISITADAVNNLSDCGSSVITLIGFKISAKPADIEHPYGHARFEYISGLIVSLIVFIVGLQLAESSVRKIISPEDAKYSFLAVIVLIVSILIKLWQSAFYKKTGSLIKSSALSAASADSRNDVVSTAAVLAGVLITEYTGFNPDGVIGLCVAGIIMFTGYKLIRETSDPLLGEAPPKELVDSIYSTIRGYDGILGIHDLNVHSYGPGRCFASVHCEVPAERDILESHDIIDNIERDFLSNKGIHLVIHMDPIITDDERTNGLKARVKGIIAGISPEIGMHDFRVVWGPTHANIVFDVCVRFGFPLDDDELKKKITEEIKKLNVNYFTVITVDHDYVPSVRGSGT